VLPYEVTNGSTLPGNLRHQTDAGLATSNLITLRPEQVCCPPSFCHEQDKGGSSVKLTIPPHSVPRLLGENLPLRHFVPHIT
jgi:hypothetical protein